MLKFADDTMIVSGLQSADKVSELQEDLDTLIEWSNKCRMMFNSEKCKC